MTAESHALSLCAPPRPCVHVRVFVQARCVCVVCVCVCVCVCVRVCSEARALSTMLPSFSSFPAWHSQPDRFSWASL